MKKIKSIQATTIVLCIICLLSLSFKVLEGNDNKTKHSIYQKKKLKDPADVRVGKVTLEEFLTIYNKIIIDVVSGGSEDIEAEIDIALGKKGFDLESLTI